MFTGIIQEIGKVIDIKKEDKNVKFRIESKKVLKGKKIGDSISVNGACQTVVKTGKNYFEIVSIPETLKLTNLKSLKIGSLVNLEESLKVGDSLDGHFVMGHIDCSAKILLPILPFTRGDVRRTEGLAHGLENILSIQKPQSLSKFIAQKGSITINGVSLTISKVTAKSFEVSLIPHTLQNTNLKLLKKGDEVNLEIDILARYIIRD